MITDKQFAKVTRMLVSYGEIRPGFLDHNVAHFEGPFSPYPLHSEHYAVHKPVRVSIHFERDSETGEARFAER